MARIYPDFEIRFGPQLGEGYPFVARTPTGSEFIPGYFQLPFAWEEIEPHLAVLRTAGRGAALERGSLAAKGISLESLGGTLYQALFDPSIQRAYARSRAETGGRLRLKLTVPQPELARLPWEYLHDGQRFLGLDLDTPIVRGVVTRRWPPSQDMPLRLLILGASPLDQARLEIGKEHALIAEELERMEQRGEIAIRYLRGARITRELPKVLLEFAPHVLHFAGHGTLDGLILEDETGRSRPLTGTGLRDLLGNVKSLQLVVLNACELAGTAQERKRLSVAARLVQIGLPMAVGMQFQISDRAALAFSEGFYEALAQRMPLEAATVWARVRISYYLSQDHIETLEWGTPVIHMSALPWQLDWREVMSRALARGLREGALPRLPTTIIGRDGKEMRLVPAGSFLMGSDDGPEDERPRHRLDLPSFWIDTYPVTNAEYARFVAATEHRPPPHWANGSYPPDKADHPVVNVSWEDAQAYAAWAGKRLPTEAEWEKAARGSDGRRWPWGDTFDASRCNTRESGIGGTTPVGSFAPQGNSPYGAADMAGNVWEWTADWYQAYPGGRQLDSFGERYRVLRGGSWNYGADEARCAARFFDAPDFLSESYGFRCVVDKEMYTRSAKSK